MSILKENKSLEIERSDSRHIARQHMIWEYKTIKLAATGWVGGKIDELRLDQMMNDLGQQGWELAAALDTNETSGNTKDIVVIFKRPKG
ncbi:MAG TPA: DUF4177 domain-containing protein [Anaerohalosphaeraceae bacterium]|nr:DUF4177 domain-containing protein [Anaerohalosphaeraceae bacterium]